MGKKSRNPYGRLNKKIIVITTVFLLSVLSMYLVYTNNGFFAKSELVSFDSGLPSDWDYGYVNGAVIASDSAAYSGSCGVRCTTLGTGSGLDYAYAKTGFDASTTSQTVDLYFRLNNAFTTQTNFLNFLEFYDSSGYTMCKIRVMGTYYTSGAGNAGLQLIYDGGETDDSATPIAVNDWMHVELSLDLDTSTVSWSLDDVIIESHSDFDSASHADIGWCDIGLIYVGAASSMSLDFDEAEFGEVAPVASPTASGGGAGGSGAISPTQTATNSVTNTPTETDSNIQGGTTTVNLTPVILVLIVIIGLVSVAVFTLMKKR